MAKSRVDSWPLLDSLPKDERDAILGSARPRTFKKGEIIFHAGDPADTLHLIRSGHVAARMTTPRGDVATLSVMGPGEFFGEMALVSPGTPRSATIVALDATETLSVHEHHFDRLRRDNPDVDRLLVVALADEARRLSDHLMEALFIPTQTRIFRRLLSLATLYGNEGEPAVIPLTQDDLASLAGTTRPTVNTVLKGAEESGFVALKRGRIEILDTEELARRARLSS